MARKARKGSSSHERHPEDLLDCDANAQDRSELFEECALDGEEPASNSAGVNECDDECEDNDGDGVPDLLRDANMAPSDTPPQEETSPPRQDSVGNQSPSAASGATLGNVSKSAMAASVALPERSVSGSIDTQSDRRIMSAAATIGGATGMLVMGPVTGVALGAAAAYATTKDNRTGIVARNASAAYLQVADRAVDRSLQAVDTAVDEGCKRLSKVDPSSVPAALRPALQSLSERPGDRGAARTANSEEARLMRQKYPDRVPVLCEKSPYSALPEIAKKKFAVPGAMLCGEFKYIVHKLVIEALARHPGAEQTIYIFVNGITPKTSTPMSELYEQLRMADGFLHVRYCAENTLGV